MKAVVKFRKGSEGVECREVPVPAVPPGCLRLKTYAAAVCGTDLHILHDKYVNTMPVTLGHEHVGVVDAAGEGVEGFSEGDTVVTLARTWVCGTCEYCRKGLFMLCPEGKSIGVGRDGAMAEYVIVPASKAFRLEGPPRREYALLEPLACCWRAVTEIAQPEKGMWALVSGPGFMGQIAAQILLRRGVRVIMSGLAQDAERLAQAKTLGVDEICSSREQLKEALSRHGISGVDHAFECAGAEGSLSTCLLFTKKLGTVTQVGLYSGPVKIDLNEMLYKEISLKTSYGSDLSTWQGMLAEQQKRPFVLSPYISGTYSLEQYADAFAAAASPDTYKILCTVS